MARVTSLLFVTGSLSSGYSSAAFAFSVVIPVPRPFGRIYSGLRSTVYRLFAYSNVRRTNVFTSSFAYLLRNISALRTSPLASPYSANVIASKIVVFPAPVSPVIRNNPCDPSRSKSMVCSPAYGPNALIVRLTGFINRSFPAAPIFSQIPNISFPETSVFLYLLLKLFFQELVNAPSLPSVL